MDREDGWPPTKTKPPPPRPPPHKLIVRPAPPNNADTNGVVRPAPPPASAATTASSTATTATATTATTATPKTTAFDPCSHRDPLPPNVRPYDHVLLDFADGRRLLARAIPDVADRRSGPGPDNNNNDDDNVATTTDRRGNNRNHRPSSSSSYPPCKINKRTYPTGVLVGLPYGTVLEVGREALVPLTGGEDLLPDFFDEFGLGKTTTTTTNRDDGDDDYDDGDDGGDDDDDDDDDDGDARAKNVGAASSSSANVVGGGVVSVARAAAAAADNRDLVDDNTSQGLTYEGVRRLMASPSTTGADVVAALVRNSSTYVDKTVFSRAKYVRRKQLKYQVRCRVSRVTPASLCEAMHLRDPRRLGNLRDDTLGQILGNANVGAGRKVMVMDGAAAGMITAACVRRMAGYGTVTSLFDGRGTHPGYCEGVVDRMNLTVMERQSLRWVNVAEVFCDDSVRAARNASLPRDAYTGELIDVEGRDRERISWPAPLQPHTRAYVLNTLGEERRVAEFLAGRSARFARKLTRHSALELRRMVEECRDGSERYDLVAGFGEDDSSDKGRETRRTDRNDDDDDEKVENANVGRTSAEADVGPRGNDGCDAPRQCDSLIIATKYDPTATLFRLLPYLAPSCPFVIYHEFLEPLLHTFHALQNYYVPGGGGNNNVDDDGDDKDDGGNSENTNDVAAVASTSTSTSTDATRRRKGTTPMMLRHNIAINLRLTDTWFREYQVLEGRTHPKMTMSQNGGYLLTGTKLCPRTGTNELDENAMRELRAKLGGRRKQLTRLQKKNKGGGVGRGKRKAADVTGDGCERKKR